MQALNQYIAQARAVRAGILDSPALWLPRREILQDWLNGFLERTRQTAYVVGEAEAQDLAALGRFVEERCPLPAAADRS